MATIFQPQVRDIDTSAAQFIRPGVEDGTRSAINKLAPKVVEAVHDRLDQSDLEEFNVQIEGIEDANTLFREIQGDIAEGILNEKDKEMVDFLEKQLTTLERGRVSGTLSSKQADIRKRTLLKQAKMNRPWLGPELSALANLGAGKGAREEDPAVKALNDLREDAFKTGRSLSQAMDDAFYKQQQENNAVKLNQGKITGEIKLPDFRRGLNASYSLEVTGLFDEIERTANENQLDFDADQIAVIVANSKNKMRDLQLSTISRAAESGVIFEKTARDELENDLKNRYAYLDAFVKAKDKRKYVADMKKFREDVSANVFYQQEPFAATMLSLGVSPDYVGKFMFQDSPSMKAEMIKQGDVDRIRKNAELGDVPSMLFLKSLEFNEAMDSINFGKVKTGSWNGTTDPLEQAIPLGMAGKTIASPEGDKEHEQIRDSAYDLINDPDSPTSALAAYLQPDVRGTMTPERKKKVKNRLDTLDASTFELGREVTSQIRFNPSTGFSIEGFKPRRLARRGTPILAARGGTPESQILHDLNMGWKIRKMHSLWDTNNTDWANEMVQEVNRPIEEVVEEKETPTVSARRERSFKTFEEPSPTKESETKLIDLPSPFEGKEPNFPSITTPEGENKTLSDIKSIMNWLKAGVDSVSKQLLDYANSITDEDTKTEQDIRDIILFFSEQTKSPELSQVEDGVFEANGKLVSVRNGQIESIT